MMINRCLERYRGVFTALVTPMKENGVLDLEAFETFIDWQIAEGIHGLVPMGTTGESSVVSHDEHRTIISHCVDVVAGRVSVMAGTGSNYTHEAVELSVDAERMGVDALLVVTPYYNKPSAEGIFQHFKAINDAVSIPIFIYDIPGRCGVEVGSDLVAKMIIELTHVVGIKDATGNLARPMELRQITQGKAIQFSGDDSSEMAFLSQGGTGIISVSANIAPKCHVELHEAWWAGDYVTAAAKRDQLFYLSKSCFHPTSSSPAPIKYGASRMNLMQNVLRLPGIKASSDACAAMDMAMRHAGIIQ